MNASIEEGSFELARLLMLEAARNEAVRQSLPVEDRAGEVQYGQERLSERLGRQTPTVVSFNSSGEVMQGVHVPIGSRSNRMYLEVLTPDGEGWKHKTGEHFTGIGSSAVEGRLASLRRQYGMIGDLLAKPDAVYQGSLDQNTPLFLHVGIVDGIPTVGLLYLLPNLLPPRAMGFLNAGNLSKLPLDRLQKLDSPPVGMITYAGARTAARR